ncbi:hypothetical protein M409DRAFT_28954 [Zasmidium cellare ATCC 36951]|uniref:Uncharacterized protein n=1 Tax=Zasmidium cellare ATCC 36951 TaxID=1080233 RepID=A0A6A6C497_ZASCE|nr:uncharacterized protein M409DRAFT_28954 [Zasmidium cellare ATCC 36951]KAF2160569.1 hypothetical protein M409DRAFT_28954 [Zasmidium cellare ATCC 36951]
MASPKVTVLSGPTTPGTQNDHELASARTALTLLKTRLGKAALKTLLAEDIAAADTYWKSFTSPSTTPSEIPYAPISVTLRAQGISSAELLAWFKESMSDIQTMWAGHPEHYINGHEVLETIDSHVSLFDLHFFPDGQPPDFVSKLLREEGKYPISMAAAGLLQADPRIVVGYACHQFRDLEGGELEVGGNGRGFEVKVGGCLPEGVGEVVREAQRRHLAVEWRNWIGMAVESVLGKEKGEGVNGEGTGEK